MSHEKQYAAFLSFADPDRDLVEELRKLLGEVSLSAYFAPRDLPRSGTRRWRETILNAIRESHCLVPILTRNSVSRPWVLYESGAGDALGLQHFAGHVAGIRPSELRLPGPDRFFFDISTESGLRDLLLSIYEAKYGKDLLRAQEQLVRAQIVSSQTTRKILSKTRVRWVFVAGSLPRNTAEEKSIEVEGHGELKGAELVEHIVGDITLGLLNAGFSISACSEVPSVGKTVARRVTSWICSTDLSAMERFRIGGLYPIDRQTRERDLSPEEREQWDRLFMEFRKSYLHDQEWLLVIGGNEGTREEIRAAKELATVRICALPFLGGVALETWKALPPNERPPFQPDLEHWDAESRHALVEHLNSSKRPT